MWALCRTGRLQREIRTYQKGTIEVPRFMLRSQRDVNNCCSPGLKAEGEGFFSSSPSIASASFRAEPPPHFGSKNGRPVPGMLLSWGRGQCPAAAAVPAWLEVGENGDKQIKTLNATF